MMKLKIWLLMSLLCLGGCQWMLSDVTKVDLRLIAKGDLNPDDNGRPSPLVVRVIELRSAQSFEAAEFFALFEAEQDTLGADWVASEEIELKPGDIKDLKIALQPDSQLIGVIGAYRQLSNANWRMIVPLRLHEKNQQTLILGSNGIAVASR